MKKIVKVIPIFTCLLLIFTVFSNIVMAEEKTGTINMKSEVQNMWNTAQAKGDAKTASDKISDLVKAIISITRTIATGIAIIMLVVLAMKYMMAAPGDKADIKKHATVYVVGAIVLFGVSGILSIIANFAGAFK